MTTVIDPLGTPSVVYNRSGIAIVEVETPDNDPVAVPSVDVGHLIVLVSTHPVGTSTHSIDFPANREVGDVIEVHVVEGSHPVNINLPAGESEHSSSHASPSNNGGLIMRKVRSDLWAPVGP